MCSLNWHILWYSSTALTNHCVLLIVPWSDCAYVCFIPSLATFPFHKYTDYILFMLYMNWLYIVDAIYELTLHCVLRIPNWTRFYFYIHWLFLFRVMNPATINTIVYIYWLDIYVIDLLTVVSTLWYASTNCKHDYAMIGYMRLLYTLSLNAPSYDVRL